jgi:LmbE family N-acetylglucosaminyl deacetylase
MKDHLKLMAILAHPDDETLGCGGTFVKYVHEGVETYLVTATRGEKGRYGKAKESPGIDVVGRTREQELMAAAKVLAIKEVNFLDYIDGELDQTEHAGILSKIAGHIRRIQPQVVITFDPAGAYGHPDHIAISQFTAASIVCAADSNYGTDPGQSAHRVSKLYYMTWSEAKWKLYQSALKELSSLVDGIRRMARPWPDWEITTRIDARPYWKTVWEAVLCHQTQMAIYQSLAELSNQDHEAIWGSQEFYRVFSTVNGGREMETDLFEGLR